MMVDDCPSLPSRVLTDAPAPPHPFSLFSQAVMVEKKKLDLKDLGFTKSGVPTGLTV